MTDDLPLFKYFSVSFSGDFTLILLDFVKILEKVA